MNGPPQKPTRARSGSSSVAHEPDRLEDRRGPLLGRSDPESLDVSGRVDPVVDDRPDALDELHVDAHAEDGRHDVGEEDGRVDAVPANRLQRHLRAQVRRPGDLEEAVPFPRARGTREASGPPGA